ncbi:DNA-directed RNA polymerase II subunit RPB11-a [Balamuthia mandrillaris]
MNKPEPHELFVLKEGEKKITYEKDTRIQNAATFVIRKEDHTIGNLIRMQLHRDPDVLFAGYKVPHPLQYDVVVKIQTNHNSSPMAALTTSIGDLMSEVGLLEERFTAELNRKQNPDQIYL